MLRRAALAVLLATALAGCGKPSPPAAQATTSSSLAPTEIDRSDNGSEQGNLLQFARGAVVVDRTGELSYDASSLYAIDGNAATAWSSPPGDIHQSVTVALAAKTRIMRIGLSNATGESRGRRLRTLRYESSLDGRSFAPLATVTATKQANAQLFDVAPTEASYLRATIVDAFAPDSNGLDVSSLQARGEELEPLARPSLTGCWSINDGFGDFVQNGAHIAGRTELAASNLDFAGSTDGRMGRFNWVRGNEFGVGILTVTPRRDFVNALLWHEEPVTLFFDQPWFGSRLNGSVAAPLPVKYPPCGAIDPSPAVFRFILGHAGRYALFGITTDAAGNVDPASSRATLGELAVFLQANPNHPFALVAHEFHGSDAAANKRISGQTITSLRAALVALHVTLTNVSFVAAGSDAPRQPVTNDTERALYSVVDLVVKPAAPPLTNASR